MTLDTNVLVKSIVAIVILCAALVLVQMWFLLLDGIVFWKLIATFVILGSVFSFIIAVKQDLGDEKKMKDDKFLD